MMVSKAQPVELGRARRLVLDRIAANISRQGGHRIWTGRLMGHTPIVVVLGKKHMVARVLWCILRHDDLGGVRLRRLCDEPRCVAARHHERERPWRRHRPSAVLDVESIRRELAVMTNYGPNTNHTTERKKT